MGGDRVIVGCSILIAVFMGWLLANAYGIHYGLPVGAVIWIAGTWVGREMWKADPYAYEIWKRHNKYGKYYAPRAHHKAPVPAVKDFI